MHLSAGGDGEDGGAGGGPGTGEPGAGAFRSGGLRVESRRTGTVRIVSLRGELDHDSVDGLRSALGGLPEDGLARILVDLAELSFCDSTGLNILLRARQDAEAAGVRLEITGPRPAVVRLFAVTGADTVLRIHPDLVLALAVDDGPSAPGRPSGPDRSGPAAPEGGP
ncbi:anti-anti-sigma factor [Streptomyces sp. TLI_053]|nr:anti-anti-sigma factor [Streptomyces sp. TLI_053]